MNQVTQELLNLIMFSHNHRRYRAGKRVDTTPMVLLTGQSQTQDWLDLLCDEVERRQPGFFTASHSVTRGGQHDDRPLLEGEGARSVS